jgi:hypothetical protein
MLEACYHFAYFAHDELLGRISHNRCILAWTRSFLSISVKVLFRDIRHPFGFWHPLCRRQKPPESLEGKTYQALVSIFVRLNFYETSLVQMENQTQKKFGFSGASVMNMGGSTAQSSAAH